MPRRCACFRRCEPVSYTRRGNSGMRGGLRLPGDNSPPRGRTRRERATRHCGGGLPPVCAQDRPGARPDDRRLHHPDPRWPGMDSRRGRRGNWVRHPHPSARLPAAGQCGGAARRAGTRHRGTAAGADRRPSPNPRPDRDPALYQRSDDREPGLLSAARLHRTTGSSKTASSESSSASTSAPNRTSAA